MAEAATNYRCEIKTDDNGQISVPLDVFTSDGTTLERRSFYLSTGAEGVTMRASDLRALGYDAAADESLVPLRVGAYDFLKVPVTVAKTNVIGASILKWLNFSISNTENTFEVDLIRRLKPIVEKGVNPHIKSAYLSNVKPSAYNENPDWYTWTEIDRLFPDSWVLLTGGSGDMEYGGEVVWQSTTEPPSTKQTGVFLYCNKSATAQKPFMVQHTGYVRCRGFAPYDPAYGVFVEELESQLAPPLIDRFYYDPISRQGKLFTMSRASETARWNPDAVLTQSEIDALFDKMMAGDASAFE